jgi:hypothetical protein
MTETEPTIFERYNDLFPKLVNYAVNPLDDELTIISDSELVQLAKPDSIDWELRLRFTRVLQDIDKNTTKPVPASRFYDGICTLNVWTSRMTDKHKGAFVGRALHDFGQATDNLITTITSRFYELVSIPLTDRKGNIDHKSAKLLLDMARLLLDRKFGTSVQRSLMVKGNMKELTEKEIEKQIEILEAELSDEPRQNRIPQKTEK